MNTATRLSIALFALLATPTLSQAEEAPTPAVAPPASADLLRSYPFDRITLLDGTVVGVEPVSPRPLPVIDQAKLQAERDRKRSTKGVLPLDGNIGLPGEPSKFKPADARSEIEKEADRELTVHLLQDRPGARGDMRDFKVKRAHIKKVEYFEDMLLAEGERLVQARGYTKAFEHYLRVQSRNPAWPGLVDHVNDLLFAEGRQALHDGEGERGLRLLRELLARKRDYPGLLDQISSAYAVRIVRAFDLGLYPKARRILHELETIAAEHQQVKDLRTKFATAASERAKAGGSVSGPERLDGLTEALRIWPTADGLESEYVREFQAVPTLDVAVDDVPSPLGPWIRSPADARVARLLFLPLLASDGDEAKQGKVAGQLAAGLESTDLGRRLIVRIKPDIPWSDGSRSTSAVDVARALIDRCDPQNPAKYQARWAELLDRVDPSGEGQLELRLKRPLLKPAFWLDAPVGSAHAGFDGRVVVSARERVLVSNGPFNCAVSTPRLIELRARSESSGGGAAKLKRIREFRYDRPAAALAAFLRGDVTVLAHAAADQVATLAATPDVKVGRYAQPAVHVLALDGRNPAIRNRMLRRGLSYAIDRKALLEETVLRHPASNADAPSDGVFPKGGYADAPGVKPLTHDTVLAAALVTLARGELGKAPIKLKLEYPAIAEVRAVVPRLVEAFRMARVEIEAVELPESQLESELRAGRRFDLAYRVLRCDEPVLDAGQMICPGYDAPPAVNALASAASPRILQLLLQLEQAAEWPTAKGLALQIDRELRDELPVLPLWQTTAHYAWRNRLKGPAEETGSLYQGIETWEVAPWIAKDPWNAK
ncbi:MAG: ABC transporter substrate-binding protein [Paludisphaera borealis]|uniref:ABC transporter substrate-binding protein n=1 Tax=Paludisphaera borealis TaxID=1387353 RepID=UPI00283C69C5|nr:ABC transporter substrate-binding protein [Paludisphaera borealis]MDR3620841.1 ABC transporter substrate-binding protein [Paludisphaera borealis]